MKARFIRGMAAGALFGAAAGMLLMPQVDKKTRKRITRTGRRIAGFTSDMWGGMMDFRR